MSKRKIEAYGKTVVLSQYDTNVYDDSKITKETASAEQMIRSEEGVNKYEYKGKVVAVGPEVKGVEIGDVIHHGQHAGTVFTFDNENLLNLNDYLILAIEKKETN